MSLDLYVDAPTWQAGMSNVLAEVPNLVPVIKGNGYGFGPLALARQVRLWGGNSVAVYDSADAAMIRPWVNGQIIVMQPWLAPHISAAQLPADPVVRTLSHVDAVQALARRSLRHHTPVIVEGLTRLQRHGIELADLRELRSSLHALSLEGFSVHLPMPQYSAHGNEQEATGLLDQLAQQGYPTAQVWLSHLSGPQMHRLQQRFPSMTLRVRVGTGLWLNHPGAYQPLASVLDVHHLPGGTPMGYRQHSTLRARTILIVSGGTTHGIGLAPAGPDPGVVPQGVALLKALSSCLLAPSPFYIGGHQASFAEPAHLHVSAIVLPRRANPPAVGQQIPVRVRMTLTRFDQVHGLE